MLSLTSPAVRARLLPARGDTARRLSTTARPRLSKHRSAAFVCAAAGTQNNASDACAAWKNVKAQRPLVQCITNFVSMDLLANTLLAAGASPAMVHCCDEVEEFTAISSGLLINVGTLSSTWVAAMKLAITKANSTKIPWVLDPVGAGATAYRTKACVDILSMRPTVVRGNGSEIMALAGAAGKARGVDSTQSSASALEAGKMVALQYQCIVAISGATDLVTDGHRVIEVNNGVPMLCDITATGCSVTGLIAAFLASNPDDPMLATAAAFGVFGLAAEQGVVREKLAPGGFRTPADDPVQDGAVYLGAPISHYPEWMTGALGRRREAHATLLERIASFGTSGYGCHHGAMRLLVVCAVRQTGFLSRMMPPSELDPFLEAVDAANISAAFSLLGLDACDQSTPRMEAAIVQMSMPADFGGLNLALLQSEAPAAFYSAQSVVLPKLVREYGPALGPLYEAVRAEVSSVATSALPWARETRRVYETLPTYWCSGLAT
eukprot:jgi/Tetstr1/459612/TSEL_004975.t1